MTCTGAKIGREIESVEVDISPRSGGTPRGGAARRVSTPRGGACMYWRTAGAGALNRNRGAQAAGDGAQAKCDRAPCRLLHDLRPYAAPSVSCHQGGPDASRAKRSAPAHPGRQARCQGGAAGAALAVGGWVYGSSPRSDKVPRHMARGLRMSTGGGVGCLPPARSVVSCARAAGAHAPACANAAWSRSLARAQRRQGGKPRRALARRVRNARGKASTPRGGASAGRRRGGKAEHPARGCEARGGGGT